MPFSPLFGGFNRTLSSYYEPPELPDYADSVDDLSEAERKKLKRDRILQILASGASGFSSGRVGDALLQGVMGAQGMGEERVAQRRQYQREDYETKRRVHDDRIQKRSSDRQETAAYQSFLREQREEDRRKAREQAAESAFGEIEKTGDPDSIRRARIAVSTGNHDALLGISESAEREKSISEAMVAQGMNPRDFLAREDFKAQRAKAQKLDLLKSEEQIKSQFDRQRELQPKKYERNGKIFTVDARGVISDASGKVYDALPPQEDTPADKRERAIRSLKGELLWEGAETPEEREGLIQQRIALVDGPGAVNLTTTRSPFGAVGGQSSKVPAGADAAALASKLSKEEQSLIDQIRAEIAKKRQKGDTKAADALEARLTAEVQQMLAD